MGNKFSASQILSGSCPIATVLDIVCGKKNHRTGCFGCLPWSQTTLRSTALAFGVYISSAAYWKPYAEVPCEDLEWSETPSDSLGRMGRFGMKLSELVASGTLPRGVSGNSIEASDRIICGGRLCTGRWEKTWSNGSIDPAEFSSDPGPGYIFGKILFEDGVTHIING